MGTSTIYVRHNDLKWPFENMSKKELKKFDELSPYSNPLQQINGFRAVLELHNGNVYPLIFWKGRLMILDKAPFELSSKYYDKYSGKTINIYEWTLLKRLILRDIDHLDKEFKKYIKQKSKSKSK